MSAPAEDSDDEEEDDEQQADDSARYGARPATLKRPLLTLKPAVVVHLV